MDGSFAVSWMTVLLCVLAIPATMLASIFVAALYASRRTRHFSAGILAILGAAGVSGLLAAKTAVPIQVEQEDAVIDTAAAADPVDEHAEIPIGQHSVNDGLDVGDSSKATIEDQATAASGNGSAQQAVELSVRPEIMYRILNKEDRPVWVGQDSIRSGPVHSTVVCSDPKVSESDSLKAIEVRAKDATDEYINDHLNSKVAAALLGYDTDYVLSHLVKENRYTETIEVSVGRMLQSHALVEFDSGFRNEIEERWTQIIAKSRMLNTGLAAAGLLSLLGVAFTYFRLDTATRGYYTGRLQFVVAVAILTLIASGVLLAKWIPWM